MQRGKCSQTETALHTHDSLSFKRCRRKWSFSSPFGMHLQPKASIHGVNPNLWFGSGFHWAMEDYYGLRKFSTPVEAFRAYVQAFDPEEVPEDVDSLVEIGQSMLEYFQQWEAEHANWKVVIRPDGTPMVEVPFSLVLAECCYYEYQGDRYFTQVDPQMQRVAGCTLYRGVLTGDIYSVAELQTLRAEYHEIVFHGKLDAVVEDLDGNWWVLDYKTAKAFDTAKLALDPQISKYCWAAEQYLDHPIEGMLYLQVSKNPPHAPKTTTKGISTDARQRTTYDMYKTALIEYYGSVTAAPAANKTFLESLVDAEEEDGNNRFVRCDRVPRSEGMKKMTYRNIIEEGLDMLHPNLRIYANPTKDCSWDCPFKDMCVAMEEQTDWKFYLDEFEERNETLKDELPKWQINMIKTWPEKFPVEYKLYCTEGVDSLEEFIKKYELEDE